MRGESSFGQPIPFAPVAQWIEHLPPEQGATGSNPVRRTISIKMKSVEIPLLCKEGLGEVEFPIVADKKYPLQESFLTSSLIGGPLAQLVEQLTLNQRATGSTPVRPTNFIH